MTRRRPQLRDGAASPAERSPGDHPPALTPWQRWARGYFSFLFHPVSSQELAVWYRQFTYLLHAGLNLFQAGTTAAAQTSDATLRRAAGEIAEAARRGQPPRVAMDQWPCAFPPFVRSLVTVGHESGLMEDTFGRLADFYEKIRALELRYRVETFYPKILILALILIPSIPVLFLRGPGAYLRGVAGSLLWVGLPIVCLLLGWRALRLLPGFAGAVDAVKLALPWLGGIVRRVALARWARAMAMLLEAGIPVTQAMREATGAMGNAALEQAMRRHAEELNAGIPLSAVLRATGRVPEQVIDIVTTGERSGNLVGMLKVAAEYYEIEADSAHTRAAITVGAAFFLIVAGVILLVYVQAMLRYVGQVVPLR